MENREEHHLTSIKSYFFAYLLTVGLTLVAYLIAVNSLFSPAALYITVAALGLGQAFIQLYVFFELGKELKPRWRLGVLSFTIMVTVIIVFGSIWIMYNLNYNLME